MTALETTPVRARSWLPDQPQQCRKLVTDLPGPLSRALQERRDKALPGGLRSTLPVFVERAGGGVIVDVDGNHLIDLASGIAVTNVGASAPDVVSRVQEQVARFTHTCFLVTEYDGYVQVAEHLNRLTPGTHAKRTVLFSTGAEAVENAVKIARVATERTDVVVFEHAFHGRSLLTMAMTAKEIPYKAGFGPSPGEVHRAPYAYPLRWPSHADSCAGEAIEALERLLQQVGADLPLAAVTGRAELMDAVPAGGLGGTYAGNPLACAAALGVFEMFENHDLLAKARRIETVIREKLQALAQEVDTIAEVRGRGAMMAIELVNPGTLDPAPQLAKAVAAQCHSQGVVLLVCGTYGNVIRLLPPLVIGEELLAEGLDILAEALRSQV